jgi:hypothetical protein
MTANQKRIGIDRAQPRSYLVVGQARREDGASLQLIVSQKIGGDVRVVRKEGEVLVDVGLLIPQ